MKNYPIQGPFRLVEVFYLLDEKTDKDTKAYVKDAPMHELHHGFGTWIRNNARFWTDGTDLVVEDIIALSKKIQIDMGNIKLPGEVGLVGGVDYSILHPDNACGIVITLYKQWLSNELTEEILKSI